MPSQQPHAAALHFNGQQHRLSSNNGHVREADVMLNTTTLRRSKQQGRRSQEGSNVAAFSDWSFYQDLKKQQGCIHVELSQIHVEHSSWFLTSLQATYKSTFVNTDDNDSTATTTVETKAPKHDFQRFSNPQQHDGMYNTQSTNLTKSTLTLDLENKEYITNLSLRTVDKISDRITFYTNLGRQVSFGSPDICGYPQKYLLPVYSSNGTTATATSNTLPPPQNQESLRKVVALTGVTAIMAEQIGCISESQHWHRVKPYVLMRALVEQRRAQPNITEEESMLQSFILEANDDIFKQVLSFLVAQT